MSKKATPPQLFDDDDDVTRDARRRLRSRDPSENESGWTQLFNSHTPLAKVYAGAITKDAEAARDIAQEGFIRMVRYYKPDGEFGRLYGTVVKRLSIEYNRREHRHDPLSEELEDPQMRADQAIIEREQPSTLSRLILQLDEVSQELLRLRYGGEGMTYTEMARHYGVRRNTMCARVQVAVRRLKELVRKKSGC